MEGEHTEAAQTRQQFEEFKKQMDSLLTEIEEESLRIEKETTIALRNNAKTQSNSQLLMAEVNDFVKELEVLKYAMSDAQK